jgi:hypothetical protein
VIRHKVPRSGHHRKESTAEACWRRCRLTEPLDSRPGRPTLRPRQTEEPTNADQDERPDQGRGRLAGGAAGEDVHRFAPIGIEEALNRMELVGHDFYLFIDEESSKPSVVYRRKGWSYGVIALDRDLEEASRLTSPITT